MNPEGCYHFGASGRSKRQELTFNTHQKADLNCASVLIPVAVLREKPIATSPADMATVLSALIDGHKEPLFDEMKALVNDALVFNVGD